MSFFITWDEVASYLEEVKGLNFLDSPKEWVDAFKDTIGETARYVGDNVFYNPNGFYSIQNWLSVGKNVSTGIESGVKSIPVVDNIITDITTGATAAGEAALATEAVGITIELSVAGWLATGLVGFGIGVASYELAPEFWTDLSNAVFEPITGEHLTPEETEPFLRKKIKTLMATDDNGHIVTYADRDMLERMYNFLQTHIQESGWNFYDLGTPYMYGEWTNSNPSITYYGGQRQIRSHSSTQTVDITVKVNNSLTDSLIQSVIHQTQLMQTNAGLTIPEPSANGLVNDLRSLYPNFNNADFYHIFYECYYTSPTVQNRKVRITGYRCVTSSEKTVTAKLSMTGAQSSAYYRYLRMGVNQSDAVNQDYATRIEIYDDNGHIVPISFNYGNALFSYEYDIETGTGVVKDDGTSYIFYSDGALGYLPQTNGSTNDFGCYYTTVQPRGVLDDYLERNGVEAKGKTPPKNGNMESGYREWFHRNKTVGTPDKNGNQRVSNYIPTNTPLTDSDTDKIINHGVNKNDRSYNDNQENTQNGQDTPIRNPIDYFNNSVDNNIEDYNKSDINPRTTPETSPTQLPDYPTNPPTDNDGDSGDTPTVPQIGGLTASGMVSVYNPTKQQLIDFSGWLWSSNFFDNFIKLFANPMDAIIGLHMIYATPISSGSEHIIVGYLDSEVSSKVVTQQYFKVDCGTINIPEYYGNATDYEPYTTIHIYLPFIGIVPLKTNDVLGKQLHLEYGVDVMTGTCLAMLTTIKGNSRIMCYTFAGNCAVQIPISGGNYAQMITGLAGFIVGGVGAIATGNPIMALGAGASFLHGNVSVQHSGSIGSNAGACGTRIPYVIITRKSAYDAQNYQHYYGFPSNNHVTLGTCKGYTQVKSCHIETIGRATDNEKTEIETLLKNGIIIV